MHNNFNPKSIGLNNKIYENPNTFSIIDFHFSFFIIYLLNFINYLNSLILIKLIIMKTSYIKVDFFKFF